MASIRLRGVVDHIRRLAGGAGSATMTDRQLLEGFALRREEAAFEALVRRHGPLVRGTCRRVLRNPADVDDAFQATFLVLARKAGSLRWHDSVAPWLYRVAYRVALKAKVRDARRQRHEGRAGLDRAGAATAGGWQELQGVLDEELHALPEAYRVPLLLCYLEGLARDEVAERLGCSPGAVKGRLERGRDLLRARLTRRGLALSTVVLASLLAEDHATAAVPPALAASTAHVVAQGVGLVPSPVLTLAQEVLHTMMLTKLKVATAAALLAVGVAGLGLGGAVRQVSAARADRDGVAAADDEKPRKEKANPERPRKEKADPVRDRVRDGDRPREGRRDGDRPREDGRREGEERASVCVVPLSKVPDADTVAAMEKVFGKQMKITFDKDLQVAILQGNEALVAAAVQALDDAIDRDAGRRFEGDRGRDGERPARGIDVVRLRKAAPATVVKLIKQYVSDKVEITERPDAKALIVEGDWADVTLAVSLARQLDGQQLHPSVLRMIRPREGEDRPRDRDRREPERP